MDKEALATPLARLKFSPTTPLDLFKCVILCSVVCHSASVLTVLAIIWYRFQWLSWVSLIRKTER
jgi:hypothetical protein